MNPGDRFLHFFIEDFIGRGNFGDVYVAANLREGRRVALKVVRKGAGEEEAAKYEAEVYGAKLQKALQDPDGHVTRVYDFAADESTGYFFIEMEYVEGDDLSTLIRGRTRPPEPREVARIGAELCGLLAWLSKAEVVIDGKPVRSVVHGDLKPGNVRIERSTGKVKVLDFGIARALKETLVTMPFSSPAYTSPERLDSGKADLASDLWAVGVMLYELMMGHLPFHAATRELIERRIRQPEPPAALPSNYPAALRAIVMRMLRHDPNARFATAGQAQAAFQLCFGAGGGDETVRDTQASRADPDPTVRAPSRPGKIPPLRIRKRKILFAGAILLSLAALASGWSTVQRGNRLAEELHNEHLTNLDQAWTQYQELHQAAWLPPLVFPARRAMKQKLTAAAFQVIDEYRTSDAPAVSERQWKQAYQWLGRALELDTSNLAIRSGLRLCEGHLARIQVSSAAAKKDPTVRQKYLDAALVKFEEAASLRPNWPDPHLGRLRIYSYESPDPDRAAEALQKAEKLGHRAGKRERAQLADAHRRTVDALWDNSRKVRELPEQERHLLTQAMRHCETAARGYQELGAFQNAVDSFKILILRCKVVEQRLAELQSLSAKNEAAQ